MSKPNVADRETVVRSTQVRTKLKGDGSWCKTARDTEDDPQEEKPWLAEMRARRLNGAPVGTSPVTSPVKSTPPAIPTKPGTERAPTTGYRTRGVFTQPDKSVTSSTSNGFSQTTQFTKKPSDSYKRIAPHTVRPTSENQGSQLSSEEQEKRTEAASNVLKKSSARPSSYVLSAAKKFESQPPDTTVVNNTVSFVATRVDITDEDEKPVSAVQPSPVVPVKSVASVPEPSPWKTVNTSVKTVVDVTANEPIAPKVSAVTPVPAHEAPPPATVSNKDLFEDMKPGCTKVATPLPELITECIQAASSKPESEISDISTEADKLLTDRNILPSKLRKWPPPKPTPDDSDDLEPPAPVLRPTVTPTAASLPPVAPAPVAPPPISPTPVAPAPVAPTPISPTPVAPTPVARSPISPTPVAPTPISPTPVAPMPVAPTPITSTPVARSPISRTPVAPTPISPTPVAPTPVARSPISPTPVAPTPISPTPVAPTPISPTPVGRTPMSPTPLSSTPVARTPMSPTPLSPTPVARTPLSTTTAITVNTESKYEPKPAAEWNPSPKPSSSSDTLTALSDTLISFDTKSSSIRNDESALSKEEVGSKDTTEDRAEEDDDEDSDDAEEHYKYDDKDTDTDSVRSADNSVNGECEGVSEDSDTDPAGLEEEKEEPAVPVPTSPGRWSQELLSELHSESTPQKTSGTLDLLADKITVVNSEARSLSMQREDEKQTDETAKETQSQEDNADPWSSRVRTTVTEWSSADPFDPYPIGTTSPNSSSDLLQPLSSISINRESSTEYQKPRMSGNALESLADDIIPIDTGTTRISTHRSWTRTLETSTPLQGSTGESQEEKGQVENSQTMIKFERKSSENDSPWDRWTSPTVYTSTTEEDEQKVDKRLGESHTVTTITTIREMHSEPEPVMDRYERYSRTVIQEEPRAPTPEPETKKGFVYVKEYVNTTEMSSLNSRDGLDSESDYLTSSSLNYGYSSPSYSRAPLSSTCTYCGQQVGDDSKLTIEHLGVNCHPACFKCGVCSKPMGDLLHSMFIHGGKVHCESCYSKV